MAKQPNILLIVTDQEYAHQALPADISLPNRDRLRTRGVTFNNHQVTTTVCTPSRSVMWTGQHTPLTRMIDNTNFAWMEDMRVDPESLPTIGHMLARSRLLHGLYKGKWHESEFPAGGHQRMRMEPLRLLGFPGVGRCPMACPSRRSLPRTRKPQPRLLDWLQNRAPEISAILSPGTWL